METRTAIATLGALIDHVHGTLLNTPVPKALATAMQQADPAQQVKAQMEAFQKQRKDLQKQQAEQKRQQATTHQDAERYQQEKEATEQRLQDLEQQLLTLLATQGTEKEELRPEVIAAPLHTPRPWYRSPWPWLGLAILIAVVIGFALSKPTAGFPLLSLTLVLNACPERSRVAAEGKLACQDNCLSLPFLRKTHVDTDQRTPNL